MLKSFLWNLKMDFRSWKRRTFGNPHSKAAKKGHANEVHRRFANERLIREKMA
jgi:hypothetical protein